MTDCLRCGRRTSSPTQKALRPLCAACLRVEKNRPDCAACGLPKNRTPSPHSPFGAVIFCWNCEDSRERATDRASWRRRLMRDGDADNTSARAARAGATLPEDNYRSGIFDATARLRPRTWDDMTEDEIAKECGA